MTAARALQGGGRTAGRQRFMPGGRPVRRDLSRELRDRISTAAVGLDPDDDPALAAASMLALSEHLQAGIVTCEAIAQRRGAHD